MIKGQRFSNEFLTHLKKEEYDKALNLLKSEIDQGSDLSVEYAFFLQGLPFDDYESSLIILDEILKDNLDIRALILKGYILYAHQGDITDSVRDDILKYLDQLNPSDQYFSQLYIILALYYRNKDNDKYLMTLLKCIEVDPLTSYPFYLLGLFYKKMRKRKKSKEALKKAKENIVHIYAEDEFINFADFDEFINESIRGVKITKVNYDDF